MSSIFPSGNGQTPRPPRTLRDVLEANRVIPPERPVPTEHPLPIRSSLALDEEPPAEPGPSGIEAPPEPSATSVDTASFFPKPPESVEEIGLVVPFIEDHIIRVLYFSQQATGSQLAAGCGVPYVAIQHLVHGLARDHVIEIVGQKGLVESGYTYMLAPKGQVRAEEALRRTWYRGPLPVPLEYYVKSIKAQTVGDLVIRRDALREAFSDLVIAESFLDRIGPAVNGMSSIFLYGAPGNGKTAIAERITAMIGGAMYIPYAIEVDGSIIMLYDELNHRPLPGDPARKHDARFALIQRPVVIAGGELTLASLDLTWNSVAQFYEAPLQMKATGGTFLIDDFGRQLVRPVDLLNRWIVPLERRTDYLTLMTGKKLEIPFDQLLIFSTNLNPADLTDEAFQRRVRFRIPVDDPDVDQFAQVFQAVCKSRGVPFDFTAFEWLINTWWRPYGRPFRMVQPRDIVNQLIAIAKYLGRPAAMEPELLDRACQSYFVMDTAPSNTAAHGV